VREGALLGVINVATGAMLGTILADSPAFKVTLLSDLSQTMFFIVLIILQSANIWAAASSIAQEHYDFALISILMFAAMQAAVFCYFCLETTPEGIKFDLKDHSYAWTFLMVSTGWFASNVVAAWLTKKET
jgi:hypothetical protein